MTVSLVSSTIGLEAICSERNLSAKICIFPVSVSQVDSLNGLAQAAGAGNLLSWRFLSASRRSLEFPKSATVIILI
jgi:hypothetical protein